jgi:O-antigen/teichoic acid export membrane protein
MYNENNMALVATIFELLVVATTIYVFYFQANGFFAGYNNLRYTGISNATKQKVVLFYSPIFNKLYTEENYYKQFPFYK